MCQISKVARCLEYDKAPAATRLPTVSSPVPSEYDQLQHMAQLMEEMEELEEVRVHI